MNSAQKMHTGGIMSKTISFTMNGRLLNAKLGETIIQVADREGIDIPEILLS